MKQETKQRLRQFGIILGCAIVIRIIIAFIVSIEIQQYFSLGIMLGAIASFFIWDVIRERKKHK